MPNLIQIKRSLTAAAAAGLANGELAYTSNGDVLFIGANGSTIAIGGVRNPGTLTANQALVANSSSAIDKINVANAVITTLTANGTTGTAGQILFSNGSVSYWANAAATTAGSDTYVQFNDGGVANAISSFTFTKASGTVTATKFSGNGASVTSVDAATVGGNTASTLRSYSDTIAGTAYSNAVSYAGTIAGTAYTNAVSTAASDASTKAGTAYSNAVSYADTAAGTAYSNAVAYAASNTYVNTYFATKASPTFTGTLGAADITVSGNLTVTGTLTTVGSENLVVKDSMIKLAANNTATDVLDIGLFGSYGSVPSFTGLFRDASDGIYKLFTGLEAEPSTTVNLAGTGYATAILQAYLNSSAFVSNSSVTNITANSTVSVALVANTLSLTTALPSTSGGTGFNSYTTGDLIVANTGNALSKLTLGTSGYVLQSNGSAVIYSTLDGGTF